MSNLNYRPLEEELKKAVETAKIDLLKAKAESKVSQSNMSKQEEKKSVDKDIIQMSNDERNKYIADYNLGKIEANIPRTQKMVRILIHQTDNVRIRANKSSELLKKNLPDIEFDKDTQDLIKDDMQLIYGDSVDTTKVTPGQVQCISRILNTGAKLDETKPSDLHTYGENLSDPNSPINMPDVPKSKADFNKKFTTFSNLFGEWGSDSFFFLKLLLHLVFDIFAFIVRYTFCPVVLGPWPVGMMLAESIFFMLNKLLGFKGDDAYHCLKFNKSCPKDKRGLSKQEAVDKFGIDPSDYKAKDYKNYCKSHEEQDLKSYIDSRINTYSKMLKRGGNPLDLPDGTTIEQNIPKPICSDENRQPSPNEIEAASNILDEVQRVAKESPESKMKDYFGLMATTSAEEESVTLKASMVSANNKIEMVKLTKDNGIFNTSKLGKVNAGKNDVFKFDDKFVKYLSMVSEMIRNIDIMVSGAIELKFLSYRYRDTICCFIRLLYAMFIGNDDYKVLGKNVAKQVQDKMSEWNDKYQDIESEINKSVKKIQVVASLFDSLLSTFTTTVTTQFDVEIGDFSLSGLGKFLVSQIRKATFEALAGLNEALFGTLRKLIFGFLNSAIDKDIELKKAIGECDLFNIAINWLQCLLNWVESLILKLLSKIRGDQNLTWGRIQANLDVTFQNKQVTLLRDIIRLIGKYAMKIARVCNVNNIKDADAFTELIDNIANDLGTQPYMVGDNYNIQLSKELTTSVMDSNFDHTGASDDLSDFGSYDKGGFGFSIKDNIIVDREVKSLDNIQSSINKKGKGISISTYSQDKALDLSLMNVVIPSSVYATKADFVNKTTKCYKNVGLLLKNNKTLKTLFEQFDIDPLIS